MHIRMTDYQSDPRPFSECLKEFASTINGGSSYGARPKAAEALCVSDDTLKNWFNGRPCVFEKSFRKLMTMIIQTPH